MFSHVKTKNLKPTVLGSHTRKYLYNVWFSALLSAEIRKQIVQLAKFKVENKNLQV